MASSSAAPHLIFILTFAAAACHGFGPGTRAPWRVKTYGVASTDDLFFEDQKLDHFSPEDSRVFKQRYHEKLDFFQQPDGPIFLVLCGEWTCNGVSEYTYIGNVSKMFGAAMVSLEHRFYGRSSPFQNFTVEDMQYLSSKQALFDAAVFVNYYQGLINKRYNKQGFNRWIVVGVSYAGALSAWFRLKFPHLVVGSWSSSGVVESVLNFTAYDKQVGISVGPACKKTLQEVTRLVENGLAKNASAVKALFHSEKLTDLDFLSYVADGAAYAVQYGFPDFLCGPLLNSTSLVETYANLTLRSIGSSDLYDAGMLRTAVDANDEEARNAFSWTWQYCTEFGFFQVAPDSDSIRSSRLDSQSQLDFCNQLFGIEKYPEVDTTNVYYGGWNISGSKIMFLNGSQDPWRHASKQISSPEEPLFVLNCHNCAHGVDLTVGCGGDHELCEELEKAQAFILSNIRSWLST